MRYGALKLRDKDMTSYNIDIFQEGEEVIAFPMEEFQREILRLKYYLEKSGDKAEDIIKGRVRLKKQEISKIGDELASAQKTIYSLTRFNLQTSLDDYEWPELKTRKRKRINGNKAKIHDMATILGD
ncbi:MAG: hypothetical protein U1C19_11780 [Methanobacteriaceae archaeon]|nr:hypothetical protein [Methanobacteriaceae archaeon]